MSRSGPGAFGCLLSFASPALAFSMLRYRELAGRPVTQRGSCKIPKKRKVETGEKAKPGNRLTLKEENDEGRWLMCLYVAGQTPKCILAFGCEEHLAGRYAIQVIDLIKSPQLAKEDQIFAVPTVVREMPEPKLRVIGDLSNTERVLGGLDLRPVVSTQ